MARVLRLDYYALKRRAQAHPHNGRGTDGAKFVEFGAPECLLCKVCTIEFAGGTGRKVTLRLTSANEADVVAMSEAFGR